MAGRQGRVDVKPALLLRRHKEGGSGVVLEHSHRVCTLVTMRAQVCRAVLAAHPCRHLPAFIAGGVHCSAWPRLGHSPQDGGCQAACLLGQQRVQGSW